MRCAALMVAGSRSRAAPASTILVAAVSSASWIRRRADIVTSVLDGYSSTVLAYGQTVSAPAAAAHSREIYLHQDLPRLTQCLCRGLARHTQ